MKRSMIAVPLLAFALAAPAGAQVVSQVVREATEQVFKSATRTGLEELAEMGGRTAVREVLEQSSREGGEQLVRKAAQYGIDDGPAALRAIGRSPAKMVAALDGLSPGIRNAGIAAVERNPQLMTRLVQQYGSGAIEAAVKHPGVGEKLVETLGADGVQLGRTLTTDQAIVAARHAPEIAALPPAQRAGILSKLGAAPAKILDYLEAHPKILATTAGVAVVMAVKDDVIGDKGSSVVLPNGTVVTTPAHPGLIERIFPSVSRAAQQPVALISGVVAVGIAGWFAVHLLGKWRAQSARANR